MKKLLSLVLLLSSSIALVSCGEEKEKENNLDTDFDGLLDVVDPTPNDNHSIFKINDDVFSAVSNDISIAVDYRNFIYDQRPSYNRDVAQMCAMIANFSYANERIKWSTSDNTKYSNEESSINPVLVQFGFSELQHLVLRPSEVDPYDLCGLYLGNHIFENENKTYQVVVASIEGYPTDLMWHSNLDIGFDSTEYYEIYGEHPEWVNKKHHKGFDVTANRAYPKIVEYTKQVHKNENAEQIVLVTGHSRGGAISNLIGKKLRDDNYKSMVYAFNGPRTTTESDENVLHYYSNIFNLNSANDYVSRYPFNFMNFTSYGYDYEYDLVEHNEYYHSLFNHDFYGNDEFILDSIDELAKEVLLSRRELYRYLDYTDEYGEYTLCGSLSMAEEAIDMYVESIQLAGLENQVKYEIIENKGDDSFLYPYIARFTTKPNVFFAFASKAITTYLTSDQPLVDMLSLLDAANTLLLRTVALISDFSEIELDLDKFLCPHIQKTCIAGAYVAEIL